MSTYALSSVLISLLLTIAFAPRWLFALDPQKSFTQYMHDIWQREQGLPSNAILSIFQSSDGYIWIGTFDGFARFDGVSFTIFNTTNTPELKGNGIWSIREAADGSLWFATNGGGVTRLKDGRFKTFTVEDGLPSNVVHHLCSDRAGGMWIGTREGIAHISASGQITSYRIPGDVQQNAINHVTLDQEGTLWIGSVGGLWSFKEGVFKQFTESDGFSLGSVWTITEDTLTHSLWMGTGDRGLYRYQHGRFSLYTTADGLPHNRVLSVLVNTAGVLWIGTYNGGICRMRFGQTGKPVFAYFAKKDGLTDNQVQTMAFDCEGNLWVGTYRGGLNRFKDGKFLTYTSREGLIDDIVYGVYQDRDGSFWIATAGGISHFVDGRFINYSTANGLPDDLVRYILRTSRGELYFATYSGICRLEGNSFRCFSVGGGAGDRVRVVYEDSRKRIWTGSVGGLYQLVDDSLRPYNLPKFGQFTRYSITFIYESRDKCIWFGTDGNGIGCIKGDSLITYTSANGLVSGVVLCAMEAPDGSMLFGSNMGISRLKAGRITNATTNNGLYSQAVFFLVMDSLGNVWTGGNNGISFFPFQELCDVLDGKIARLNAKSFDRSDGMKTSEVTGACMPVRPSKTGELWIPTGKGVVVVNPYRIRYNPLVPPVRIEHIRTDKGITSPSPELVFPPDVQRYNIHYTALSFVAPEKMRFKTKLEGFNADWNDMGNEREITYTNLPPKLYTFRVIACNNDGIWNEQGASISFKVEPRFYQSLWFILVCAFSIVLTAFGAWSWRIRQMNAKQEELRKLVEERTRDLQLEKENSERQREIAQAANEFKTELIGVAANELKTPLKSIMDFTTMLLNGEVPLHLQVQYLNIIRDLANRMSVTVDKLLDSNILGIESLVLRKRDISLKGLAELAVMRHQDLAAKKSQRIELSVRSDCIVFGDEDRLTEMVGQLISNAIKYSPFGKTIWVTVCKENQMGRIEVHDEGQGLSEEDKFLLFRKFQRLSAQPTGGETSVGLGLALVKRIVDLHNGKVWAESDGKGKGATFIVELPAVE
ncbi:MAG: two-component regulator propeller domain-containing protein [Chloroherpetonaceae bacterium]|nr:two-component regulator propeller domain-containing protein [Chloroherpetonaceae bacterium]